jgi:hypothetical protein
MYVILNHPYPIGALLAALVVHDSFEADALALSQLFCVRDVPRVDKDITPAIVRPNESVTLLILKSGNRSS